ncbi:MAG TPA: amidohydrolase family protein [Acidimicrobiales bacterium]|nr:amidohydrolase family protein [Acidimicrobiales bacterium]
MGYIDCDAHVWETDETWDYLQAGEEQFRPAVAEVASATDLPFRFWLVQDQRVLRNDGDNPHLSDAQRALFPEGTKNLKDVPARLREMDRLGVDVQVLFPSLWLNVGVRDPIIEAALKRSYNRWMAAATECSHGRLRWMINVPTNDFRVANEELEFGSEHGAAGVFLLGDLNGRHVAHPSLFPLYEKAEQLGLVVGFHVGVSNTDVLHRYPGGQKAWDIIAPCTYAFYSLLINDVPARFPGLKWGFFEAGAAWVPWMLQEVARLDPSGTRSDRDWRTEVDVLERNNMYIACQIDDDLPYLITRLGSDNVVCGSDWAHIDIGSDPAAQRILAGRTELDAGVRRRIVDSNGRRLFGIDEGFTPSGATVLGEAV